MFNNIFFVSACNWCGLIQREVSRLSESIVPETKTESNEDKKNIITLTLVRIEEKPNRVIYGLPPKERATLKPVADSGGFVSFFEKNLDHDGIQGKLDFLGNEQHEVYLEFRFKEPQEVVPFKLEVCFAAKSDEKKEYEIDIPEKDKMNRTTGIKSFKKSGIDYSSGIEDDFTVAVIRLDNT